MITCSELNSTGRLGNQIFLAASTIGIADKLNTSATFPAWKYEQHFKHPLPHGHSSKYVKAEEKNFHYDQDFINSLQPENNYDLKGYFQSYKYWDRNKILNQFEFNETIKHKVAFRYRKALNAETVAISIRRGDFVNNDYYFQIPISYYLNAYYRHFEGKNVIIFSDDFKYCKTHFKAIQNIFYADQLTDIEQLCLMSMCDNHIISNSTFSWWGAYLSNSKKVIRPEKNFDNRGKENNEKDYWPKHWEIFKDYQLDLSDTTFIIPVFYDHQDRKQNIKLTLAFLNTYFNTNILIGEQGGNAFEDLKDYAEYVKFDYDSFHRTKMINELAKMAKTPIVINWDCDNICSPAQLYEAVKEIRKGADIVYPFDGNVCRVPRYLFPAISKTLDVISIDEKICIRKPSSVGHAVVMNKKSFIKSGMENENFISWGPEDSERYNRYKILGLTIQRIPGAIYHMDHYCGENSSCKNEWFKANEKEYMNVTRKNKSQLQEYIKTWGWVQ